MIFLTDNNEINIMSKENIGKVTVDILTMMYLIIEIQEENEDLFKNIPSIKEEMKRESDVELSRLELLLKMLSEIFFIKKNKKEKQALKKEIEKTLNQYKERMKEMEVKNKNNLELFVTSSIAKIHKEGKLF